ncbi:MAG: hypothetical protein IIB56_16510 [Planctomycetes bacterium]|nr:hypothetical protein [Planctomycetota bacterium]
MPDLVLTNGELAFDCQQFGSQYCPGTKDSPQESQTISKRLASTNNKVTEVCQKVLCGIHAANIIQLVA